MESKVRQVVTTVGQLRSLIDDLPDEQQLRGEVLAADGTAWQLSVSLIRDIGGSTIFVVSDPRVETLAPLTPWGELQDGEDDD